MIENSKQLTDIAKENLRSPESIVNYNNNGVWTVKDKDKIWDEIGLHLYDQHLDAFKELAVTVLSERDPAFELPTDERYMARIHGKNLEYSKEIRESISETLGLLGSRPEALKNCSKDKVIGTAILAIRKIFEDADVTLWGSLNDLLPNLSEAAPEEFLNAIERDLELSPCPFDLLYAQEGNAMMGRNYMTGLLWALEGLAWDKKHLVRVCVILGELAKRDPGGNWANRPENSIVNILLPWFPQTKAPIKKRKVAVETLIKEVPEIGWKVILNFLPNQVNSSSGSHKPQWRMDIPDNWEPKVSGNDYWKQVGHYADMSVDVAKTDTKKLSELIKIFDKLPDPAFSNLLEYLSSDEIVTLSENERSEIWEKLREIISRHTRFSSAEWSMPEERLSKLEKVLEKLEPENPVNLYRYLFDDNFDLYEEKGDYDKQEKLLDKKRQDAVSKVLESGFHSLVSLINTAKSSRHVGHALGKVANQEVDDYFLPEFLSNQNHTLFGFISNYVLNRFNKEGWDWVDGFKDAPWALDQKSLFLCCLPFIEDTWDRVETWLKEDEDQYWKLVDANPYAVEKDIERGILKLLQYDRPEDTIMCFYKMLHDNQSFDKDLSVKALLEATNFTGRRSNLDTHYIEKLIEALQDDPDTKAHDLYSIEWAYLPLLDKSRGLSPKFLEYRLAEDPDFFCEVIQLIYRSKDEINVEEKTEEQKAIASNAWHLLHEWSTVPGTSIKSGFSADAFSSWVKKVREKSSESGHLEVALIQLGGVLIHSPKSPNGLWIHEVIADELNKKESDDIRRGLSTGFFNSRGCFFVDPTGKPEKELAEKYGKMADDVENASYQRLAVTLRNISERYKREAEQRVEEHSREENSF